MLLGTSLHKQLINQNLEDTFSLFTTSVPSEIENVRQNSKI